ncbi:hypothetical protein C8Q75DRAFT_111612 [Abortiporus biennis]|nr:hypothetical protein C8Q75DRAFT_111612 [Abortiporus biennis]
MVPDADPSLGDAKDCSSTYDQSTGKSLTDEWRERMQKNGFETNICQNFVRGICFGTCHRRHPSNRQDFFKYLPRRSEPCEREQQGRCTLGELCFFTHPSLPHHTRGESGVVVSTAGPIVKSEGNVLSGKRDTKIMTQTTTSSQQSSAIFAATPSHSTTDRIISRNPTRSSQLPAKAAPSRAHKILTGIQQPSLPDHRDISTFTETVSESSTVTTVKTAITVDRYPTPAETLPAIDCRQPRPLRAERSTSDTSVYLSLDSASSVASSPRSAPTEVSSDDEDTMGQKACPPGTCHDWFYGTCLRKPCRFRHSDEQPKRDDICPPSTCMDWFHGTCLRRSCKYRHSVDPLPWSTTRRQGTLMARRSVIQQNPIAPQQIPLAPNNLPPRLRRDFLTNRPTETQKRPEVPLVPPGLGLENSIRNQEAKKLILNVETCKVTFGSGFEIQELVTAFESREIYLQVPSSTTLDKVKDLLVPFGETLKVTFVGARSPTSPTHAKVRAVFSTHDDAAKAAAALDGTQQWGRKIDVKLGSYTSTQLAHGTIEDSSIYLALPPPGRTMYVGYATRQQAEAAISKAHRFTIRNFSIFAELHNAVPQVTSHTVRFRYLPIDIQKKELLQFGHNVDVMEKPDEGYRDLDHALSIFRTRVLDPEGEVDQFNVEAPPYPFGYIRAWVQMKNPSAVERMCRRLHNSFQHCFKGVIQAIASRHVTYLVPREKFNVLRLDVLNLRSSCPSTSHIEISDSRSVEKTKVKLLAQNLSVLKRLKSEFEHLLNGNVLKENGDYVWDPFFGMLCGAQYLGELEKQYPLLVEVNTRRRQIVLFGHLSIREHVRKMIQSKLFQLRRQRHYIIPLEGRLIGLFMSSDLMALQQRFGHDNVTLDLVNRRLIVRGNEEAHQTARSIVLQTQRRHAGERNSTRNACPVCLDEVTSPVTLICSHSWCKACLSRYLLASIDTKNFPLKCLGNEARCVQHITLQVAQEVLSPKDFDRVAGAAVVAHVQKASEFHYCPTPDCPTIYRSGRRGTVIQCPSCLRRICPYCHVEEHQGQSCQLREEDSLKLLDDWTKDKDVKRCPECRVIIERSEGCNHMTCVVCRTHICWVCLETFPQATEVYDHMRSLHGGFGM